MANRRLSAVVQVHWLTFERNYVQHDVLKYVNDWVLSLSLIEWIPFYSRVIVVEIAVQRIGAVHVQQYKLPMNWNHKVYGTFPKHGKFNLDKIIVSIIRKSRIIKFYKDKYPSKVHVSHPKQLLFQYCLCIRLHIYLIKISIIIINNDNNNNTA